MFSGSHSRPPPDDDDDEDDERSLSQWERQVHSNRRHPMTTPDDPTQAQSSPSSANASDPLSSPSAASPYLPRQLSLGQRVADRVAEVVGSWRFVITQSCCLLMWLLANSLLANPWDPYPFILLNLALSFQAAYTAPIIMMASNRAAEVDRGRASDLHEKVDHIRLQQMMSVWEKVIDMDGEHMKGRQVIGELKALVQDMAERMQRLEETLERLTPTHTAGGRGTDKEERKEKDPLLHS